MNLEKLQKRIDILKKKKLNANGKIIMRTSDDRVVICLQACRWFEISIEEFEKMNSNTFEGFTQPSEQQADNFYKQFGKPTCEAILVDDNYVNKKDVLIKFKPAEGDYDLFVNKSFVKEFDKVREARTKLSYDICNNSCTRSLVVSQVDKDGNKKQLGVVLPIKVDDDNN